MGGTEHCANHVLVGFEERWERWRLLRLAPINDALEGEDAERHAARVERFGEPAFPEDRERFSEFVGPTSALSVESTVRQLTVLTPKQD